MTPRPNIFDYNNFREFLRDMYAFRRDEDRHFTKAHICKQLGLPNSRSYFQDVLNGKGVTDLKVPLFIKLFRMTHDESLYFRVLVRFNQCDTADEKELLLDQLISLNRTPQKHLTLQAFSYYKEWYHAVVRAILDIIEFDDDYAALARSIIPPVKVNRIRESVKLLAGLGLIAKNKQGFFKPTDKVLSTLPFARDPIVHQFQVQSLEAALRAFLSGNKQPHRVMTKTISISEQGYKRIERHLDKFNSEIRSIVHKDEQQADRVYQLTITLVPHLRKVQS
jgi:uncharacterized protein (TIGR02147 family)